MKRLITLCVVLTAIALAAAPVFAEVQNVKVSGDVKSTGVYRENYLLLSENQLGVANSKDANGIITNARVRIDADLTDNVSATVRYLTEYYWDTQDNTSGTGDDVDLDIACVTLKEAFYGPLTMMIGRQPLKLGTGFVLADPDTNTTSVEGSAAGDNDMAYGDLSMRKSFDAIRAVLDYNPLVVDLFYSKIDETNATNAAIEEDVNLYGINAAYDFENYDAEAEVYYMNVRDGETTTAPDPDSANTARMCFRPASEVHLLGVRGSLVPMDNLNLLGEFATQRGDYDTISVVKRDLDSYAYQVAGDYTFQMEWNPVVRVGFTHYEGEQRDNTGDFEGWLPLFEDQTHGVVANYILGGVNGGQNSNADILNIGATAEPMEDLTVSVDYYNFWLDEKWVNMDNVAVNNAANGLNNGIGWYNLAEGSYLGTTSDNLGYEIDLALNYDYTEDVKMGISAGWFCPGDALDGSTAVNTNNEKAAQILASVDVAF